MADANGTATLESATVAVDTNQYLTFSLAGEEYGVDILKVQEIKGYVSTTRLPNSPRAVVGVLNLRGTIVPIVDLRRKFGMEEVEYDPFAAIVVVVVDSRVMGMIVDRVRDVVAIPAGDVQPPPELERSLANTLCGVARMGDKLVILLDVEAVMLADLAAAPMAA